MRYPALRWAGVQQRLKPWARRLGIGAALSMLVASGGAGDLASGLSSLAGLAGWSLLPWVWLARELGPWAPLLAYSLMAGLWGLLLRPWLLPMQWLEAERQLPIARGERWRSDAAVAAFALLSVWTLQGVGLIGWLHQGPLSLSASNLLAGLPVANLLGLGLVVLALTRRRALPNSSPRKKPKIWTEVTAARQSPLSAIWALLALPLWRGPWPRSARWLALSSAFLLLPIWVAQAGTAGAWMALWVLLAGIAVQRAAALLRDEGEALMRALAPLPLHTSRWTWARQAMALLPLLPSALAWTAAGLKWRPAVLAVFLLVLVFGSAWLALQRLQLDENSAVRALLLLALLIALGTESLI